MTITAERLYELLPAIYRIRDAEQGGALKDLVSVIAEQVEALEENLAQSYDDHFIETCADWVIPYIGDLIGYRTLHGVAPKVASQRAEVANTIGFRRRKGTASMLEQLARDVTGWNARVVEYFELLATNQYMNHIRLHNQVTPDLRQWEPLERLDTAFDTIPRTINIRRIATEKGKHNIPNIGIFLWRLNDYALTQSPAVQIGGGRFMFSSLGINTPLFTYSEPEDEITHIAKPLNVPEPISRRVLNAYLEDYYGAENSLVLRIGIGDNSESIDSRQIAACNLSDIEEQRIRISGHSDGQYTLSFAGQTTDALNHDASPSAIQTALEALDTISVGDITVTGTVTDTEVNVTVIFSSTEIDSPNPLISIDVSGLNSVGEITAAVVKNWAHRPLTKIAIDPVLGRIALPANKPQRIRIQGHNAGQYTLGFNGNESVVNHSASIDELRTVLSVLSNVPETDVMIQGMVTETEIDFVVAFGGLLSGLDVALITVDPTELTPDATVTVTELEWSGSIGNDLQVDFRYGFSADMGGGQYERQGTFDPDIKVIQTVSESESIQQALESGSEDRAVEINNNGRYDETLSVELIAKQRLELRAGNGHRPTIISNNDLVITGEENSEAIINGLLIVGAGIVIPSEDNSIRKVTLRHCTLVPGLTLTIDGGEPQQPDAPSLLVEMENVTVEIDHCIIGGIRSDRGATIEINDSILDATATTNVAFGSPFDGEMPGGILEIINSTVIGRVFASAIPLASNVIFFSEASAEGEAPVRAVDKQTGCVRFSYVPPGSAVPRRYRCQPDLSVREAIAGIEKKQIAPISEQQRQNITNGVQTRIRPGFNDLRYGRPAYCQLRHSTPLEIRTGADDESEMGVFHQLFQPQRETNLRIRLDEYLRFGLEAGFFYAS